MFLPLRLRKDKKVAGYDSSDLRNVRLPTLDTLRNFFLVPTTEILSVASSQKSSQITLRGPRVAGAP